MATHRHFVMLHSKISGPTWVVLLFLLTGLTPVACSGQDQKSLAESRQQDLAEAAARRLAEKEDRPDKPQLIRPSKPGEAIELTFDNIKFDMEKGTQFKREMLSEEIEGLHGKTIRLRGFIKPGARQKGLKKFVFVRDDKECCFGPGAAIFDCVLVQMEKENPTDFTVRPVTIEGKFYLKEYKGPDGNIWAIYRMKDGLRK